MEKRTVWSGSEIEEYRIMVNTVISKITNVGSIPAVLGLLSAICFPLEKADDLF